jgi:hypothetical protein
MALSVPSPAAVSTIAHTIQLAVAPVFLVAGIGALLNVLTARLARVVDRARVIEAALASVDAPTRTAHLAELAVLDRRMVLAHRAISLCTSSALFVCLLVALLFIANLVDLSYARIIAGLFVLAMALLIGGLLCFLTEIRIATRSVRVSRHLLARD